MSSSRPSTTRFWIIAFVTVAAASLLAAVAWHPASRLTRYESYRLSVAAESDTSAQAQSLDQLATWLDPYNLSAQRNLAQLDLQTGHDTQALQAINQSGQGIEVTRLRVQAYLELGRNDSAAHAARELAATSTQDSDLLLAVQTLAAANQSTDLLELTDRIASPEARRRAQYARSGTMPLAYELAATGFLRSPQAILAKLPQSYQRNLLLATIDSHLGRYPQAVTSALGAAAEDPSAAAPHLLLEQLYQNDKNLSAFKTQRALLSLIAKQSP